MNQKYSLRPLLRHWLRPLAVAALLASGNAALGQALNYTMANVVNEPGTYVDLGSTGTVINTVNFDDANSGVQTIPFAFSYNGTSFQEFVLNTNGYIRLGNVTPTTPYAPIYAQDPSTGPLNGSSTNLILPFNVDLQAGIGGTEYRMATTGTAPNRVLTIQWKNVSDKAKAASSANPATLSSQYANISFQVLLYEGSNEIDFKYGAATASTGLVDARFGVVGLKGSGTATNQVVTLTKTSTVPWGTATPQAGPYVSGANGFNFRNTVLPDAGRTFRFFPTVANDASVAAVYGYDQLVVPAGQPVVLRAQVTNTGTGALSNLTVNLTISGANAASATQTIASLAVGASTTVTFPAVSVPTTGSNAVTVALAAADGNPTNNSRSMTMVTNATTTSYITPGVAAVSSFGFGPSTEVRYFAARISLAQPRSIAAVNAYITDDAANNTVGQTMYGVVVDAVTGTIIARSADFVATAATVNQLHTFTLTTPVTVTGDVLVGMAQTYTSTTAPQYYPMGVQPEAPSRTNTFYVGSVTAPIAPSLQSGPMFIYKYMLEAVTAAPVPGASYFIASTGVANTSVTLNGFALSGTTSVSFNGVPTTFVVNSNTSITAVVPAGATSGPVTVVSGGNTYTSINTFTVLQPAPTTIVANGYREARYGAALALQATPTGFGNATNGSQTTALNGSELDAAYSYVHGDSLYVFLAGNLEDNGNAVDVFFDSQTGGQNVLSSISNSTATNGANNMVGLRFDTGFAADYYLSVNDLNGQVSGVFVPLATGTATTSTVLASRSAQLNLGTGRTGTLAIDNSNTGGVNDANVGGSAPAGVVTGIEFALPLAALGSPQNSLKISAFINNPTHDYLSNQVLGSLPTGTPNLTTASVVNFASAANAGNQYFTVTLPTPVLTAVAPGNAAVGGTISLTGTNLSGTTVITFTSSTGNVVTSGYTVNAAGTQITGIVVPTGATTGTITVRTAFGTSNGIAFTVNQPQLVVSQGTTNYFSNGAFYSFGNQVLNVASAPITFTLNNPGAAPLTISNITTTGSFAVSGPAPTTVAPGSSATVGITFTPTFTGAQSGSFRIESSLGTYVVNLTGNGVYAAPAISGISPTTGPVGTVVTITGVGLNTASSRVSINGITIAGVAVVGNTLIFTIPAGTLSGPIVVTTPGGTASSGSAFCVQYTPVTTGASTCAAGTLTLRASGSPTGSYLWYTTDTGNTPIPGVTGASYTIPGLVSTATYYVAIGTGTGTSFCEGPRTPVTATINAAPVVTIAASGSTSLCAGEQVTLTASGAAAYVWSNGATTPSITVSTSGNYAVSGTSTAGCSATSAVTPVTVSAVPVAPTTTPGSRCGTGSVTVSASGAAPGSSYAYYTSLTGGTAIAGASGASYVTPSLTATTTYYVSTRNGAGCEGPRTAVTAIVNPSPVVAITSSPAGNICAGAPVTLTASGADSYLWSNGATTAAISVAAPGTYTVTGTNAAGCPGLAATTVVVEALPAQPTITQTTPGVLTSSSATGNQWYLGGSAIPGATGQTYVVPGPAGLGSYTLVVSTAGGCASPASAAVMVTITATATQSLSRSVTIFPNPARTVCTVQVPAIAGASQVQLTLLNALGQVVQQRSVALPATGTRAELPLQALASGVYQVRIQAGATVLTKRLVIE